MFHGKESRETSNWNEVLISFVKNTFLIFYIYFVQNIL